MKRALLVIDVQNEYFTGRLPVSYPPGSLENILSAMDGARRLGIPIVVVQHTAKSGASDTFVRGTGGWELHPLVVGRSCDLHIEKSLPGSFTGTSLEGWLKAREIERVTITGYMSQMCCDTTSRQAMHRGYSVEFLSDATGTLAFANKAGAVTAEELHRAVLVTQAMYFADVMTTDEWLQRIEDEDASLRSEGPACGTRRKCRPA